MSLLFSLYFKENEVYDGMKTCLPEINNILTNSSILNKNHSICNYTMFKIIIPYYRPIY